MNSSNWGTETKYGEFEIVGARDGRPKLLGEGAFGRTFEAVRTENVGGTFARKSVAIKVLNPDLMANHAKRFQFVQELLALTEFKHPNLVSYLRCGEEKGEVYYAMELCRGGDLARLVRKLGPLPEKVVAVIGMRVAAGLREIHQRHRLVHRAIKLSNVLLTEEAGSELSPDQLAGLLEQQENACRVADFGLVTFALNAEDSPQRFVGSAAYASPEQIREQPLDGRSDIFALGMTLWHLLLGKGPLLDDAGNELTDEEARERQTRSEEHEDDLPADLAPEFRSLLGRMVAKRPEKRFSSAAELQKTLQEYVASIAGPAFSRPASRCEAAMLTRIVEPLESVYDLEERLSSRGNHNSYSAREKATGRLVKVNVVSSVDHVETAGQAELDASRLCRFAELSRDPSLPAALLPVQAVVWASDLLAYTEDIFPYVPLAELLKSRNYAKRPVGFAEAVTILRPIAEALDFLLQNGQEAISIPCDEVWLTGSFVESLRERTSMPATPLSEWEELQVRFSMVYLPQQIQEELPDASGSSVGQTMSGSLQMSAADSHPVPVFARLVYRILNGSEVAAAVQFAPYAFVPAVTLCYASNNLIRDVISRQRPWIDATTLLKDLCAKEGVILRTGNNPAVARVLAPGVVQSPYAAAGATQRLSSEQWAPGAEFVCAESGRKVLLPTELPIHGDVPSQARPRVAPVAPVAASVAREPSKGVANESRLNGDHAAASQKAKLIGAPVPERHTEPVQKKVPLAAAPARTALPAAQPPVLPRAMPPPLPTRRSLKSVIVAVALLAAVGVAGAWHFVNPVLFHGAHPTPQPDSRPTPPRGGTPLPEARTISKREDPSEAGVLRKESTPIPVPRQPALAVATPPEIKRAFTTPVPKPEPKVAPKQLLALSDISQALAKNPNDAAALTALGDYNLARKDLVRAKENYTRAMVAAPEDAKPLARRGHVWALSGSFAEAHNDYQAALQIDPRNGDALLGLGELSMAGRDYGNAVEAFSAALRANPELTDAILGRARCYRRLLALDRAKADFESYVAAKNDNPVALSEYAWLLATAPSPSLRDGAKARDAAFHANKLTGWSVPDYLDTYAAALAESGNFDEAVKCEDEALTRAARSSDEYRNQLQSRKDLYEAKKPFRQKVR